MVAVDSRVKTPVKKVQSKPDLKAKLRLLDQTSVRSRNRKRNVLFFGFVVFIVVMFIVAYAQAKLVSKQQDLDLIQDRVEELQREKALLESSVNKASAPQVIFV